MSCGDSVAASLKGFGTHGITGSINGQPPEPME